MLTAKFDVMQNAMAARVPFIQTQQTRPNQTTSTTTTQLQIQLLLLLLLQQQLRGKPQVKCIFKSHITFPIFHFSIIVFV